jgi:formylglycine-generating enzyme
VAAIGSLSSFSTICYCKAGGLTPPVLCSFWFSGLETEFEISMKTIILLFLVWTKVATNAWSQQAHENFVKVEGGSFKHAKSNFAGKTFSDFYIGKYEVTQAEWIAVMGNNPSKFKGENLPVDTVSWYDCVEYCNRRSIKEGLKPYYAIDKNRKDPNNQTAIDDIRWTVIINAGANGYRLPTEAEWEYAACGARLSKSYIYSGSDDIDKVAWYWQNSGEERLTGYWHWPTIENNKNQTKPVGGKEPNELGLYDMSGNVREWCWDWYGELESHGVAPTASTAESGRVWKGGGWLGAEFCCESSFRGSYEANGRGPDQGLRLCRGK